MHQTAHEPNSFALLREQVQSAFLTAQPDHLERLHWDARRIADEQALGLRSLVAHAVECSPFHRRRLSGVDVPHLGLEGLAELPVMTKADMMDELDDVFTDRAITPAAVERALAATGNEPVPIVGKYFALASGGSSGHRGVFVVDRDATVAFFGALSRTLVARLNALGGPPPGGLPIAQVAAASAVHATGSAEAWTAGGVMPLRFHSVPVTLPIPEICARLEALQAPMLFGYPSMLARLAREQRAGRLKIAPIAVTTSSETLFPDQRDAIAEAFRAPIVDAFGSTEGLVGTSAPDDDVLVFNTDSCIVELVDEHDEPVPDGVASAKVLLTNLTNRVQPLIRYEITDSFTRRPPATDHGHLRATVHGRADDVLRFGAVDVHPLVIRSALLGYREIIDYQVHQTTGGIAVDAVAPPSFDTAAPRRHLVDALAEAGLRSADVRVRRVTRLAAHPETGKCRRFVPLG